MGSSPPKSFVAIPPSPFASCTTRVGDATRRGTESTTSISAHSAVETIPHSPAMQHASGCEQGISFPDCITHPDFMTMHTLLSPQTNLPYADLSSFVLPRPAPSSAVEEANFLLDMVKQLYNVEALHSLLSQNNLSTTYSLVTNNLWQGFALGCMPWLAQTIVLANNRSAIEDRAAVTEYLDSELRAGRMSGPFSWGAMCHETTVHVTARRDA